MDERFVHTPPKDCKPLDEEILSKFKMRLPHEDDPELFPWIWSSDKTYKIYITNPDWIINLRLNKEDNG